jgi:hypothetical protein
VRYIILYVDTPVAEIEGAPEARFLLGPVRLLPGFKSIEGRLTPPVFPEALAASRPDSEEYQRWLRPVFQAQWEVWSLLELRDEQDRPVPTSIITLNCFATVQYPALRVWAAAFVDGALSGVPAIPSPRARASGECEPEP